MQKEGLISKRTDYSARPIKCEYSLTKAGEDFISIIKVIKKWSLRRKIKNKLCEEIDCENCKL